MITFPSKLTRNNSCRIIAETTCFQYLVITTTANFCSRNTDGIVRACDRYSDFPRPFRRHRWKRQRSALFGLIFKGKPRELALTSASSVPARERQLVDFTGHASEKISRHSEPSELTVEREKGKVCRQQNRARHLVVRVNLS